MEIRMATKKDINGIFELLKLNHVDTIPEEDKPNCFVTTKMSEEQMLRLIELENGITVAEENNKIYSFAMAASWDYWEEWPFFANMIKILGDYSLDGIRLNASNSYQYGPICVEKTVRGSGIFEKVFFMSLSSMKDRFPIMATFINHINPRSYAAHTNKAKMRTLGNFDYNSNHYYFLACHTK